MKTYQVSVCVTFTQTIIVQGENALIATAKAYDIALEGTPKNAEIESLNTVGIPNESIQSL